MSQMFPCFPTRANIVSEIKFASREEAKMFPAISETFDVSLCFSLFFPSVFPLLETRQNIGRKQWKIWNASATMFPSLPRP